MNTNMPLISNSFESVSTRKSVRKSPSFSSSPYPPLPLSRTFTVGRTAIFGFMSDILSSLVHQCPIRHLHSLSPTVITSTSPLFSLFFLSLFSSLFLFCRFPSSPLLPFLLLHSYSPLPSFSLSPRPSTTTHFLLPSKSTIHPPSSLRLVLILNRTAPTTVSIPPFPLHTLISLSTVPFPPLLLMSC